MYYVLHIRLLDVVWDFPGLFRASRCRQLFRRQLDRLDTGTQLWVFAHIALE